MSASIPSSLIRGLQNYLFSAVLINFGLGVANIWVCALNPNNSTDDYSSVFTVLTAITIVAYFFNFPLRFYFNRRPDSEIRADVCMRVSDGIALAISMFIAWRLGLLAGRLIFLDLPLDDFNLIAYKILLIFGLAFFPLFYVYLLAPLPGVGKEDVLDKFKLTMKGDCDED